MNILSSFFNSNHDKTQGARFDLPAGNSPSQVMAWKKNIASFLEDNSNNDTSLLEDNSNDDSGSRGTSSNSSTNPRSFSNNPINRPLYKLRRNKIYSSFLTHKSITNLNHFHPFLYDFDPKKRVYKMTCEKFLEKFNQSKNSSVSEPSSFNLGSLDENVSIYFLYDYDRRYSQQLFPILKTLMKQEIDTITDKIQCFVIVRDERELLEIQQGQTYVKDLNKSIETQTLAEDLDKPIQRIEGIFQNLDDVYQTEYEVLITKGLPMYVKTFFKAYYEIRNCHHRMLQLFGDEDQDEEFNSIIIKKFENKNIAGYCEMEKGTENKYYLFKVSTDMNFSDLERFQYSSIRSTEEMDKVQSSKTTRLSEALVQKCIQELIPKILFVNLMMFTDYNIIDTLKCYFDFVRVIERRDTYDEEPDITLETVDQIGISLEYYKNVLYLLTTPEHIIYFRPCIDMLFHKDMLSHEDYEDSQMDAEISLFDSEISNKVREASERFETYNKLSQEILATKYSFGAFL